MNPRNQNTAKTTSGLESLMAIPTVPATKFADWAESQTAEISSDSRQSKTGGLSASELKLVLAVVHHPMRPSSEYIKLAGISPNTLGKIRPSLVEKGFIRENKLETGGRGRSTILIEPLQPAKEAAAGREE